MSSVLDLFFLSASSPEGDVKVAPETFNSLPAGLGNPPPLLSMPGPAPSLNEHPTPSTGTAKPAHGHPTSAPGYLFVYLLITTL